MALIEYKKITPGLMWVAVPSRSIYIQCGCPADSVKHMIQSGFIREHNGIELGPNTILLSDLSIQNGQLSNMAEFSVLQMFYRQGMILPNHPGYNGQKPLLIGHPEPLGAQLDYIFRGNYGLTEQEVLETASSPEEAEMHIRIKLSFAFGKIQPVDDILRTLPLLEDEKEIGNGVFIRRLGVNIFEFRCDNERLRIDLNLAAGESYRPTHRFRFQQIVPEFFSVIHSGEGDGWDVNNPSMASIVCYGPDIYLIDAGPFISHTLRSFGLSLNSVKGIFQTHAHDDHFAGLCELMLGDRKIEYYAPKLVRESVEKKLRALLNIDMPVLESFFTVQDFSADSWNNVDGLEVYPSVSPHPVETYFLKFRAMGPDGYKTYHHLADIASFEVLKNMIEDDSTKPGLSRENYDRIKASYLERADLKKIDAGGGIIHGQAGDFREDQSTRIIFSHSTKPLTMTQQIYGTQAHFGQIDHLIQGHMDYRHEIAARSLHHHFPTVPFGSFYDLLNQEILKVEPGIAISTLAQSPQDVFLILKGIIASHKASSFSDLEYQAGYFINDGHNSPLEELRAKSWVELLRIPACVFRAFLVRNNLLESFTRNIAKRRQLEHSDLFSPIRYSPLLHKIARSLEPFEIQKDKVIKNFAGHYIFLLEKGSMQLFNQDYLEVLKGGNFCYEDNVLLENSSHHLQLRALEDSYGFLVPHVLVKDIPAVEWKLLEAYKRRSQAIKKILAVKITAA
ncbi:MAG: MBL fold metallo-hydrolase [Proteobacteria bacterium]|nr:MAG: MBL fold metallo-hydrolase [Pseudomonadota bacterium]